MDLGAPIEQFLGPAEQGGGDGALKCAWRASSLPKLSKIPNVR